MFQNKVSFEGLHRRVVSGSSFVAAIHDQRVLPQAVVRRNNTLIRACLVCGNDPNKPRRRKRNNA